MQTLSTARALTPRTPSHTRLCSRQDLILRCPCTSRADARQPCQCQLERLLITLTVVHHTRHSRKLVHTTNAHFSLPRLQALLRFFAASQLSYTMLSSTLLQPGDQMQAHIERQPHPPVPPSYSPPSAACYTYLGSNSRPRGSAATATVVTYRPTPAAKFSYILARRKQHPEKPERAPPTSSFLPDRLRRATLSVTSTSKCVLVYRLLTPPPPRHAPTAAFLNTPIHITSRSLLPPVTADTNSVAQRPSRTPPVKLDPVRETRYGGAYDGGGKRGFEGRVCNAE
ncbi:hypothetical protein HYPSUDRAFT_203850 [Hypholoma sublateritium FD-334 SS-4]|uniref:Uncharacterized protein n=1 Tax=Hypholoma sublateritium (strain FD-334 SS-4) TaxID=945553 RepID=A0A0D2L103_HYPSF|nr:hypothetical protein HYPSUDRAFT_203850 [Hypholoma sublateritium FD-334 SS-4]